MKQIMALGVVISIAFCCFYFFLFKPNERSNKSQNQVTEAIKSVEQTKTQEALSTLDKDKLYCIWLTYTEIGSLVKGRNEEEYRAEVEAVFENLKENKINTVFYQCRAFCDSFYQSEIFPVSKYISSTNKELSYDPFEIFLEIGKERNIAVHCWVNPYRVSYDNDFEKIPKSSPVRALYKKNKNSLIICKEGLYLNPADSSARRLVLDGIREILNNYQVDGIHFDDYFYPDTDDLNDGALYEVYQNDGGGLSLSDWRRENVNSLVSGVYALVKSIDSDIIFSISPSADIKKCKNVFYADIEKWCSEEGFVDFLIPQIYFGFENEKMPFSDVVKEWERLTEKGYAELVCGLAVYKCGEPDENAGSGKNEWLENVNILSRQYEQLQKSQVWQGFSLFSYSYAFGDNMSEISNKEIKKLLYMVE